jgi:hypothetical protein
MTEVRYPDTTMKVVSGTESTIITPQSLQAKETINDVTTTITPSSVVILDNDPSFPANMTILQDSINSSEVGTTKSIQIDKTGFYAKDESGHKNGVLEGIIYSTKPDGTYLNLDVDSGININGLAGVEGQVLQKSNPGNAMVWAGPPFQDTANNTLDMNYYGITNVANINSISATDLNINGQTVFNTPPHIPDPVLGNDAASKGYVDTLIGNYSGNGLTLYFNYGTAQTDPIIAPSTGELQQTLAPINSPTLDNFYTMQSAADGSGVLISTFTTDVGYPNTQTIPTGLWSMLIWGYASSSNGNLYYHFHLNEVDSAGAFVAEIATSGYSSDVNATSSSDPDAYHCSLALVAPHTMASVSNRLQIQIYTSGNPPTSTTLYTLFGGNYYSNVTTTLNGSTSLLTQNNTWTGVNNFTAGFLTGGVDSAVAGTLNLGTTNSTLTTIGSTIHPTAINAFSLQVNIAGNTGSVGQVLTSTGNPFAGVSFQNPAFVPTATQALNMATFGIVGNSMDSASLGTLSLGTTNATTTTLGRSAVGTIANLNGKTINIGDATSTLNIAGSTCNFNGTTNTFGDITATYIDNPTSLNLGATTATDINIGSAGTTLTADIEATTITLTGAVKTANIDRATAGTLAIGGTTATRTTMGRTATGTITDVVGETINLTGAVKTSSIDTAAAGALDIGSTTATSMTVGSTSSTNTTIRGNVITLTGNVKASNIDLVSAGTAQLYTATATGLTIGSAGATATFNTSSNTFTSGLTTPSIASSAVGTAISLYTANTGGVVDFLTSASRTATLNIQNSATGANNINIGSSTSTTNIRGLTMPSNQFITMGTNTALPAVNQIGYIYTIASPNGAGFVDNSALTTGVAQEYGTIASLPAGVYMVSANLNMQQVAATTITSVVLTISATGNTPYIDRKAFSNGAIITNNYSISGIVSRAAVLTAVACSMTVSFTGTAPKMSIDSFKFNIVRIA